MESYNLAEAVKKIYDSGFKLLTFKTLQDIWQVKSRRTFFDLTERLVQAQILEKLEKGKYSLQGAKVEDFQIANFLYFPSYISFETALNFHGILSQFPYTVTSATTRKSAAKKFSGKKYEYSQINKDFFWGFEKQNGYLIAQPEKALCDQMYFNAKGLKNFPFDEFDLTRINKKIVVKYLQLFPKLPSLRKTAQMFAL